MGYGKISLIRGNLHAIKDNGSVGPLIDFYFFASHSVDLQWVQSSMDLSYTLGLNSLCGSLTSTPLPSSHSYPMVYGQDALSIKARTIVTASSGVTKAMFRHPPKLLIHMPHSLISLTMAYPKDAFDGYDGLFASGPHHVREWNEMCQTRHLGHRFVYDIGYGKLDRMAPYTQDLCPQTIMIAPSWGPGNLLETLCKDLIQRLSLKGYRIIVRPHPMFFIDKQDVLTDLQKACPTVQIESSLSPVSKGFYTASALITDYSGIGFEYAAFHGRRPIFVNTPLKSFHPEWDHYTNKPIELTLRHRVGVSCDPNLEAIVSAIESLKNDPYLTPHGAKDFLFHPFMCADYAVSALRRL